MNECAFLWSSMFWSIIVLCKCYLDICGCKFSKLVDLCTRTISPNYFHSTSCLCLWYTYHKHEVCHVLFNKSYCHLIIFVLVQWIMNGHCTVIIDQDCQERSILFPKSTTSRAVRYIVCFALTIMNFIIMV